MIETRLLARLLATARAVTPPGAAPPALELGDEHAELVRAQVTAQLADGSFRVLVEGRPEGQSFRAALPLDTKPGDVVAIRVAGHAAGGEGEAVGLRSPAAALSHAGRLISALLSTAPATPTSPAQPLLASPSTVAAKLVEPLARAVERSGLFYESHQARWANGDYPLERLLQEPQNAPSPTGSRAVTQTAARPSPNAAEPAAGSALTSLVAAKDTLVPSSPARTASPADEAPVRALAPETVALMRQQLEALDGRHITWLGEIWPGQQLHWEIEADDSSRHSQGAEPGWKTRFSLELPMLGEIGAEMTLAGSGVRLHLHVRTDEAAALMRAAGVELTQALLAAGVAPVFLAVSRDEPAA